MSQNLIGAGVALVTPFEKTGKIDFTSIKKILTKLLKSEINYIVVLGTTGETPTLTNDEKQSILTFVKDEVGDKKTLVAGFGGNNTAEIIHDLSTFDLSGYSYILSTSPYYNKPSQEGIYQHYKSIAKATKLSIILYNVPGRTSSNILPETTLKLAREIDNIVAIKEASGSIDACIKLVKNKPKDFVILSGDDNLVVAQMAIGVQGCISVIANLLPDEFSNMIQLCLENKYSEAKDIQLKLSDLIDLIFEEGNPVGIKTAMNLQNLCLNHVRLPLVQGTNSLKDKIKKALIQF